MLRSFLAGFAGVFCLVAGFLLVLSVVPVVV